MMFAVGFGIVLVISWLVLWLVTGGTRGDKDESDS